VKLAYYERQENEVKNIPKGAARYHRREITGMDKINRMKIW
jgi:hypothetical protein